MLFKKIISVCAVLLITTTPSQATISSDLGSFWNGLGGSSNITTGRSFHGQGAGYYTFGNIRLRGNSRSVSLFNFSLPSVEAGCGGIDLFAGALSFIDADQLVQLGRAIVQNAVGYAFDLALETISPVIAETMKDLRARLQELNLNNIDSCETAQALVGSVWPRHTLARDKICSSLGSSSGIFTDYASARHECDTDAGQTQGRGNATDEEKEALPENVNVAWHVMRGDRVSSSDWLKSDKELSELAMTLTGTVIIKDQEVDYKQSQILDGSVFEAYMTGGSANSYSKYVCDEADECLNVSSSPTTAGSNGSFRYRVSSAVTRLFANARNNTTPLGEDVALVQRTTFPLWKIINVYAAYSGPIITGELDTIINLIAIDMTLQWVESLVNEVVARSGTDELAEYPAIALWLENLRDTRKYVTEYRIKNNDEFSQALRIVERVQFIERALSQELGGRALGNAYYHRGGTAN